MVAWCLVCGQWLCQDYELSMHINGDVRGCFGCLSDPEVEPIPVAEIEERKEVDLT